MVPGKEGERNASSARPGEPRKNAVLTILLLARLTGNRLEPKAVREQLGRTRTPDTLADISRVLKGLHIANRRVTRYRHLCGGRHLPAVVEWRRGGCAILLSARSSGVVVRDPASGRENRMSRRDFLDAWTGSALLVRAAAGDNPSVAGIAHWLIAALARHRALLFDVLAASAFVQLFALVTPLIFMVVIDKVLSHRSLSSLDVLVMALGLVSVFEVLLAALRARVLGRTTARMDLELSTTLFRHVISLPISYFGSRKSGDVVARMRELEGVRNFITGTGATAVLDVLFLFLFLVVMALFSVRLTVIVVGMLVIILMLSIVVTPVLRSRLEARLNRGSDSQSFLVEAVAGIETIKSFAAEKSYQEQWENRLAGLAQASMHSNNLSSVASQITNLVSKATIVLLLWLGARMVMEGELTVGQLIAFNMLATRVNAPVIRIAQVWQELQQARVSLRRLAELQQFAAEPVHDAGRTELPSIRGEIAFERVCFRYRPDRPEVLRDVSFRIGAGEKVALIGPFGCGKSTLARLVQRLYVPERGRVLVDGMDVAAVDGAWLRRQVGIVSQDVRLLDGSIRENIALGLPDAEAEAVTGAAQLAGAHDFIVKLPDGYETVVGEQGAQLSTGQRQCLSIARALLIDPPVLILDEATSSLDPESERMLCSRLETISAGRTLVIITHRPSLMAHVHRVLVLRDGQIVSDGPPGEIAPEWAWARHGGQDGVWPLRQPA